MNSKLLVALGIFVFARTLPDPLWRLVPIYYSYAFEVLFIAGFIYATRALAPLTRSVPLKRLLTLLGFGITFGAATSGLLTAVSVGIPFEVTSLETVFLLLVVGPLLEELLYRYTVWESLRSFLSPRATLIVTTLFFAAAHLTAYAFVPDTLQAFVLYQTVFVTLLGLLCGFVREKDQSFISPYAIHFGFNLGFFLVLFSQFSQSLS